MKIPLTNYLKPGAPKLYRHSESLTGYAVKKRYWESGAGLGDGVPREFELSADGMKAVGAFEER